MKLGPPDDYAHCLQQGESSLKSLDWAQARAAFTYATKLRPKEAIPWMRLAVVARVMGDWDQAFKIYQHVRSLPTDPAAGLVGAASLWLLRGLRDEAQAAAEAAMELQPQSLAALNTWFLALQYQPELTAGQLADAARWVRDRGGEITPARAARVAPGLGARPLRVGYVSPDFCQHSVLWFFNPLLRAHRRGEITWYGYALGSRRDGYTEKIRAGFDHWRDLGGLDDPACAARIAADKLDVLVDLAGRFGEAQPGIFAWRPAPVQIHYLGFCGPTGVRGLDYRITDILADPPGTDEATGETIVRLADGGGFHVFDAIDATLPVAPPPWRERGHITFGSFNNYPKLNSCVFDAWAALLRAIPTSRLVLRCESLGDAFTREACAHAFVERGVAVARLDLRPPVPKRETHFAQYGEIDVALDPFPYNGVTTTCDALWQGVPVATVRGQRHSGRIGESLLTAAGLSDWIYASPEELVAKFPERLALPETLPDRAALAARFRENQSRRAPALARELEKIYTQLANGKIAR
ncbi:MAG: hypothetical protein IT582_04570 [Opitutaceae bacterium]|nr:hypothetical protein [Opitutaceae bacterium]